MDLTKDVIEKLVSLAVPNEVQEEGLKYYDKPLTLLEPPIGKGVQVQNLQGLVDLFEMQVDGMIKENVFVLVVSPIFVVLAHRSIDIWKRRQVYASANVPTGLLRFKFNTFMDPESFVIGLQTGFQRTLIEGADGSIRGDLDYVLRVASSIAAEGVNTSDDDGIAQTVSVKRGIVLKSQETLKSRVELAPFRTFPDVNQPLSTFLLRARGDDDSIELGLFEADGGRWQIDAMAEIAKWIKPKVWPAPVVK